MHHVANVNADLQFDAPVGAHVVVALGQRPLDLDRALGCFQRAIELDQESVTDRFDLGAVKARKDFPEQPAMFLQQFQRELVVALRERAVAHHVAVSIALSVDPGFFRPPPYYPRDHKRGRATRAPKDRRSMLAPFATPQSLRRERLWRPAPEQERHARCKSQHPFPRFYATAR